MERCESFDDDLASFPFVGRADFVGSHDAGDRNLSIKIIGVRGSQTRNTASGLGKGYGVSRVGVNHGVDVGKGLEQAARRVMAAASSWLV